MKQPKNSITLSDNLDDEQIGQAFLEEIKSNPHNIKQLLEEFINISYRYEKDVKDAKALYEWVIEMLPQAIWVYNKDGSFFYRNSLAISLSSILESIKPANLEPQEVEYNQKTYLIQTTIFQHRQLITATDITTQKRQERLASMGQISAHLAHEIRNPIGSMSLLASSLEKNGNEAQRPIIDELQKSIFRVERIINATLLFSKGTPINRQPTRLSALKEDLLDALRLYSYTKEISIDIDFSDNIVSIDNSLIGIALQNFLFNAIDAIEEGSNKSGEILVKSFVRDDEVIFSVKDNGKPFEDTSILFEPFVTTKLKGNGLGLALARQIIEAHNGRIALDSKQKEFTIHIKRFENVCKTKI